MMQKMREKTQGIIAGVVVFLVCLTFALWGIQNYTKSAERHLVVATVNGSKITQQSLQSQYEKLKQYYLSQLKADFSFDQQKQSELKKIALQQLIKSSVVIGTAQKMGFFVGPSQLGLIISSFPEFQTAGQFSPEKFQLFLQRTGTSEEGFLAELKNSVIAHQLQEGIVASEFTLPVELDRAVILFTQRRDFSYLLLPPKKFAVAVKIADADLQKYYQQQQAAYVLPEQISIEYVQLTADMLAPKIQPTMDQLRQFYTDNPQYFTAASKANDSTAKNHIPPFVAIIEKVKDKYIKQKLVTLFADATDKLTDLTYTNSDSLQPAATALGLTIKTTGLFTQQPNQNLSGILANPKIIKAAFSEGVLKQGYNSNVIELESGNVIVLRIKQHLPEAAMSFAKVKDSIRVKLLAEKSRQQAAELGKKLYADLAAGKDISAMANKYQLAWITLRKISRTDKHIDPTILQTAFSLGESVTQTNTQNDRSSVKVRLADLGEKGYALIKLEAVYPGNHQDLKTKELSSFQKMLDMMLGRFPYMLMIEEMMANAKIVVKDESLEPTAQLRKDLEDND